MPASFTRLCLLLFCAAALFACGGETPASEPAPGAPASSSPPANGPQVEVLESIPTSTGTSTGERLWEFNGYPLSKVLTEITGERMRIPTAADQYLNFRYYFPDTSRAAAQQIAVRAILAATGHATLDTAYVRQLVTVLDCGGSLSNTVTVPEGVARQYENGVLTVHEQDLQTLVSDLNRWQTASFVAASPGCKVSGNFPLTEGLPALEKALTARGLTTHREERPVRMLSLGE
ncbi:hypothetical protein QWY85_10875 [Neolewinella lacunae]|uniref:Uncharacterized protein n=1 Tax=Neolewinella lacunae TaxID=1517758 RepID=A0A923PIU0_9BACT|nr:hypothetical protein [Neolewinella lacunae]MBC6993380.1 hypothetical protein [Neolewinella lacunae]MDN3635162.1 hypothetical protein [Neolewinella lacunae]